MPSYTYAYLLGAIVTCVPPWLLIFFSRKDLRVEMILLGIAVAIAAPPAEIFFTSDYWNPQFIAGGIMGIEDSIIMFFAIGIAAGLGKILLHKRSQHLHYSVKRFILLLFIILSIFLIGIDGGIGVFMSVFKIVSIYASMLVFLIFSFVMLILRRDLLKLSLTSMVLMAAFSFIGYQILTALYPHVIQQFWHINHVSGMLLFGVPLEEILWAGTFGLFIGPFYEFIIGLQGKKYILQ